MDSLRPDISSLSSIQKPRNWPWHPLVPRTTCSMYAHLPHMPPAWFTTHYYPNRIRGCRSGNGLLRGTLTSSGTSSRQNIPARSLLSYQIIYMRSALLPMRQKAPFPESMHLLPTKRPKSHALGKWLRLSKSADD